MAPIYFTILLELALNTLVDVTCLSTDYILMRLDNKLDENFIFLILFYFALSKLRYLIIKSVIWEMWC